MQLSVREAASLLDTDENTIYRWIDEGSIPVYLVDEQYRFNRAELLEWATARQLRVSARIFAAVDSKGMPLPGLDRALHAGGIHHRVGGSDRESMLRSVVALLRLPPELDPEFLIQVLLAREGLGSTAIGDGIAIPHVRNPVVLNGCTPAIALCFLENAIDLGARDRQPVRTIFALLCPTIRVHLHLLSRLSAALHDSSFRSAVANRASPEQIHAEAHRIERDLSTSSVPSPA